MKILVDLLLENATQVLTLTGPAPSIEKPHDSAPLGVLPNASVAVRNGVIVGVGPTQELCASVQLTPSATVVDARGAIVTPGLIDCHTHALFVGDRSHEFAMRMQGSSYAEIAAEGGGIASTVRALRNTSSNELYSALSDRLRRMRKYGVTCVEVKTGYGLDTESELRCLSILHSLRSDTTAPTRIRSTFLPLHAIDPELKGLPDGRAKYLARTMEETVPSALNMRPDFVDAYVDSIGFSVEETRPFLALAKAANIGARLHVGQFAEVGGAALAAEFNAASADHLEHVSDEGLHAMVRAGVVGVLLPGAALSLRQAFPDARRLRAAGLEIAVATDCNPGTSYVESLPLAVALAVNLQGLTLPEAWWSVTRAAAKALRSETMGRIEVGLPADLAVFELPSWEALAYRPGDLRTRASILNGKVLHTLS